MILQACLPLLPNRNALVSITHCCRKLPGIQISFDVATETLSLFGDFPLIQKDNSPWYPILISRSLTLSKVFSTWQGFCLGNKASQLIADERPKRDRELTHQVFWAFALLCPCAITDNLFP